MKYLILLPVISLFALTASAQWTNEWLNNSNNKHLLYANSDLMVGNSSGGKLAMSFVYDCKYSVEFGYLSVSNQFNTPLNGLKSAEESNALDQKPHKHITENYNLMLGRHINLNATGSIRFVLQGGPGMAMAMEWADMKPEGNAPGFVKSRLVKSNDFSIMVNSKFEFPITDLLGFSAGPTLVMSEGNQYITFNIGIMYGVISKI
jgi:hypothetical protein